MHPFDLLTFAMCRSRSPRAYAFRKLHCELTRNIDSFRDFKLEAVIKNGGTPSALAMKGYRFKRTRDGVSMIIRSLPNNNIRRLVMVDTYNEWEEIPEEWRNRPHTMSVDRGRFNYTLTRPYEPDSPWYRSRFWIPFEE